MNTKERITGVLWTREQMETRFPSDLYETVQVLSQYDISRGGFVRDYDAIIQLRDGLFYVLRRRGDA